MLKLRPCARSKDQNCVDILDEHENVVATLTVEETDGKNVMLTIERVEERIVLVKID